ncbi:MAG: hypothetical protein ACREN6_11055 [Gemmatimonadaceae bacterium]
MLRAPLRAALAALLLVGGGRLARAQQNPTLEIKLPPAERLATTGPLVLATNMLGSPHFREPLAAGFTARFHFLVTLWSEGGLTNAIERRAEYDVLVEYHVAEKKYEVVQLMNDRPFSLGKFVRVEDAERAVARPTRVAITAFHSKKRFYYRATLDVQILGASDLDEVNRWLKGEVEPAIHGERNPGTALTRSIRMLASRLLGGDSREFEAQTPVFRVP